MRPIDKFYNLKRLLINKLILILSVVVFNYSDLISEPTDSTAVVDTTGIKSSTIYKALALTTGYYALSMYVLGETWYKDRDRAPFHFYNDNQGFLQVDKFGHIFGSYVYSYIGYHFLKNSGFTRSESLYFGATLGFVLMFPIEIMDGIHEGYGFSWGDIGANTLGSALVLGQDLLFKEQIVKYKFSYWQSDYSEKANGYLGKTTMERMLKDYNGHTYWLSMPINKILNYKEIPPWLNIAVGYGANGMYGEYQNISAYNGVDIPNTVRYRQYLLSLDIDWTNIETDSEFLRFILKGLTFIKLPFPAIEYNFIGKIKWHWIYY
jgi:hypothetical protein